MGLWDYELCEEWGEIRRGSTEGILQGEDDCSQLFLSLRFAGGGGCCELGDCLGEVWTARALPWLRSSTFCANWVRFVAKVWRMDRVSGAADIVSGRPQSNLSAWHGESGLLACSVAIRSGLRDF